ncbi:MAG TPA: hypothetical protein VE268_00295 [Herpetosiphonaceae bacterium]|nr:hypothetical protein [Herpetosiphonaceae bacterium]
MPRPLSRVQRHAPFMQAAGRFLDVLAGWYDQHPAATFGELEAEARRQRRRRKGPALALLVKGRERGLQVEAPACPQCVQPIEFEGYRGRTVVGLAGDTGLERATYTCPGWPRTARFRRRPHTPAPHGSVACGAARVAARPLVVRFQSHRTHLRRCHHLPQPAVNCLSERAPVA